MAAICELCVNVPFSSGNSTWIVHMAETAFRVRTAKKTRHGKAYSQFHHVYWPKQKKFLSPSQFQRWRNNSSSGWEELRSHIAKDWKQTELGPNSLSNSSAYEHHHSCPKPPACHFNAKKKLKFPFRFLESRDLTNGLTELGSFSFPCTISLGFLM